MEKHTDHVALIFAGGVGQRMKNKTKPKQFLELYGKPIIIYTLEVYEQHPEIDGIVIACVAGWQEYLEKLIGKYDITKVRAIVPGGATGQESIRNGVYKIHELYPEDSLVLVHDGVRPLIEVEDITGNIRCAEEKGNAVTVAPVVETVGTKGASENETSQIFERDKCLLLRAPQTFRLKEFYETHKKAEAAGRNDFIDSACLMKDYGFRLYTVMGGVENIKITTPMDFYIFRAIVDARENSQVFG